MALPMVGSSLVVAYGQLFSGQPNGLAVVDPRGRDAKHKSSASSHVRASRWRSGRAARQGLPSSPLTLAIQQDRIVVTTFDSGVFWLLRAGAPPRPVLQLRAWLPRAVR